MTKEEILRRFQNSVEHFLFELNDKHTRHEMMIALDQTVRNMRDIDRAFNYTLMFRFIDETTDKEMMNGDTRIMVELVNHKIVSLEEYAEILSDKDKYAQLLKEGIEIFGNKFVI